ncbi:S-layer homology domain-containing protein [Bacillus cereus]|uniref:S-layer homology domain-containing protein n=1 Tax=Bacillus cereus TaxID=1396 RepID=UPI0022E90113|nr:S-layer homology domain-containing protein [Bacillus cereus]
MKKTILTTTAALTMMGTGMGINVDHIKPAEVKADTISFYDVPNNHWATKAITNLANRNIVAGYGNGQFGFGDNVTRGQVARMIYNYLKPADAGNFKNPFSDIKGHMFEKEILALAKVGIIKGYGEGKFGPDDILTREQMAQVLTNAFKFEGTKNTSFVDVDKNSWSYKAIGALEEKGVTIGTGGNMYSPASVVTREQYSQFLFNSINVIEKEKETKPEEKPNTGGEVKPEEKPNTGEETKPVNVPEWLETSLATNDFTFTQAWYDGSEAINKAASTNAQQIVKNINSKYGTNLKYSEVGAIVKLVDGSKEQFMLSGMNADDFGITFMASNNATVELAKGFVTLVNPNVNLDQEIQDISLAPKNIKDVEKGNYKIHISPTMKDKMISIQITKK